MGQISIIMENMETQTSHKQQKLDWLMYSFYTKLLMSNIRMVQRILHTQNTIIGKSWVYRKIL